MRFTNVTKKTIPRWNAAAANLVKAHLKLRGITYARLSDKLKAIDVFESDRGIANKLSRGGFPFTFYLQCMKALGHSAVTIDLTKLDIDTESKVLVVPPDVQSPAPRPEEPPSAQSLTQPQEKPAAES